MQTLGNFRLSKLGSEDRFWMGNLPPSILKQMPLEILWALHPEEYPSILIHGRWVKTPRWGKAYGRDYRFSGQLSQSLPIPEALHPVLSWAREEIEGRLKGLLLNWYDGSLGHYIGKHRDKTTGMIEGSSIVTVSFGETRLFRMRQWKGTETVDFEASHGAVFVLPYDTNKRWTHEIPRSTRYTGRRVS
ncbi:MAG: alpha-ketoglutarate-dependent dioxygenase AlkB, partial [bacterium]|nr:alpha-ketoglutarate-dependent dioxygenase AlkB [bacterium]